MNTNDEESSLLDSLVIASPCSIPWEAMTGDNRKRLCNGCSRVVHNISDMTKNEAEEFLTENGTSHCMIFYRRFDGTILTDDCPVGLRKLRDAWRFTTRIAASALAMLIALPGAFAQSSNNRSGAKGNSGQTASQGATQGAAQANSGQSPAQQVNNSKGPWHMNRFGAMVPDGWKEPTPPPGFYYAGNPAGGGMVLRPVSEKPGVTPQPVTPAPKTENIPMPGAPIYVPPGNQDPKPVGTSGKPGGDSCHVPPLVVRKGGKKVEKVISKYDSKTFVREEDIPVDAQGNKLLDTAAQGFYEKGRAAQKIGRKDLAEYYFEHALEAFDKQKGGDQRFRNEILRSLELSRQ